MLKLAGAALVFVAAALYGRGLCEKIKRRLALLEAMEDLISYIGESIETLRQPLGRIFEDYQNTFLEKNGFTKILRREGLFAAVCSVQKDLPAEIFDCLSAFSRTIGGGYASEQTKLCILTGQRLQRVRDGMCAQLPGKMKVYRLMPLLAAASVLILIL